MSYRLFALLAIAAAMGIQACAQMPTDLAKLGGWTTLIDGETGLENWTRVGDANWRAEDGAIVAYRGKGGFLVSKSSYKDFQLRAEFWADHGTNSGIFVRAQDPKKIGANNAYEVNIYDQRPGPEYGTAGIVDFAKIPPHKYKAGGKWNTFEITAKGDNVVVVFNGDKTVDLKNSKFAQGPFSLQFGNHGKQPGAPIKWRKVQVKEL
jgi:hypothetical protein